jgi:hypothetical protein
MGPTFEWTNRFSTDWDKLESEERALFRQKVRDLFVPGLTAGELPPGLRVKRVRGTRDVWELTWDGDGRGTFQYGDEIVIGDPHVVWRRIGGRLFRSGLGGLAPFGPAADVAGGDGES